METRATKLIQQDSPQSLAKRLEGLAANFDNPTTIYDQRGQEFREVIRRGAFNEAIKGGDIRALFDHDPGRLLARQKSGTLRLEETNKGLWFSLDLPDTREGEDVRELVKRGDLDGMSFGWAEKPDVFKDKWSTRDGKAFRELLAIDLQEISVVTFPAYQKTSVELRSSGLWEYKLKIKRCWINNSNGG
jgi:HK97 family phage prohead protease